ncbi:Retrotransposable element Tf2 [Ceratobasidium theobromae]|uniref:Retrotransposable element Tf2 n=1 Tax=Ceratobasidium theobromae TaxID=1582974 RepID=A0A5N5Q8X8_9AGAM|nr:Retrotransposable element Tf2 [Ceratobasidium theobromae]
MSKTLPSLLAIFYCLPLGSQSLILGMPWLSDANPLINWRTLAITILDTEQGYLAEPAKALAVPPEFQEFTQVFGEEFFTTLPPHCPYDCEIPLEEGKDVPCSPIYPMTPAEPSTSPAGAPVMFVKRADGRLRLVVDYRRLNNITIKNRYALPRQDELIEKLKHAKIFTKLDLRNGFNNVCIKEGDEWKTAFRTKYVHFEYTVMPFGLTNAPAVFQRLMNNIFRDLLDIYVIVYLVDILIFSNSKEEHLLHIKEVLCCLDANQLFCNPDKCFFLKDHIGYIGLTITPEGISMEQEKVKAIREWPTPSTVKQVQSFLGFANFYRRFVQNFSSLARPLTYLTQKNQPWTWGEAQQAAFNAIKAEISKEPTLAHPNENKHYFLETDASGTAMGAVLSQWGEDGRLHPVAFMSSSFSSAEMNYDTHDKELQAIVQAFEDWRIFLEGTEQPVTVFTDHRNLECWKTARTINHRHACWYLTLPSYNFVFAYRPGKQSGKPDRSSTSIDKLMMILHFPIILDAAFSWLWTLLYNGHMAVHRMHLLLFTTLLATLSKQ